MISLRTMMVIGMLQFGKRVDLWMGANQERYQRSIFGLKGTQNSGEEFSWSMFFLH